MPKSARRSSSLLAIAMAPLALTSMIACQAKPAAPAAAAPAIPLQTYTAPDQTASAGVPSGWKVVSGAQTVITMTGPQGESLQPGALST